MKTSGKGLPMRRRIRFWVGLVLVFGGTVLIATPLFHEWQQDQKLSELETAMNMVDESDADAKESFEVGDDSFTKDELNQVYELDIPSIDLNQKILGETTEENLSMALTQIKSGQKPGKGNFTIAGHRGYRGDRHFRELPDVENGEEVRLKTDDKTYTYEVNKSDVIEPTDVDILDDNEDKDEITLITCTIDGQERIAVQGYLVHVE